MKKLNPRWKTALGAAWLTLAAGGLAAGCGARITADGVGECPNDPTACPSVTNILPEPAGENCPTGGVAVRNGFDADKNGVISDGELTSIAYVCNGATGETGEEGRTPEVASTEATEAQCPNGGFVVTVDGAETVLCNGTDGTNGTDGVDGEDGVTPTITVDPATDAQCPNGGTVVTINDIESLICQGVDGVDGEDGHTPEVSVAPASLNECKNGGIILTVDGAGTYICNGENGANGADGRTPVIKVAPADDNQCPNGGAVITVDDSGTIVCNGAPGETGATGRTPVITVTPATAGQCAYGGAVIAIDGIGSAICNGAPGRDGRTPVVSVTPAGVNQCPYGGALLTVDGSGTAICTGTPGHTPVIAVNPATEGQCKGGGSVITVDGVNTVLCNGITPRVTTTSATAEQCAAGGVVIAIDSVQNSSTVVCNGEQGVDGQDGQDGTNGTNGLNGPSALVTETTSVVATDDCPGGTRTIRIGVDDGAGGGIARNSVLEAGEVRSTSVSCLPAPVIGGSGTGPNAGEVFSMGNIKDLETLSDGSLSPTGNISVIENDYLWVVNTADSSVSKWDAQAKAEIARYKVGLKANECVGQCCHVGGCNMPSRVVMDSNGDAYVANRGFGIQGTVAKIAADVSECVDRNGNGQIDTSSSATPLGWNDAGEHLDECILWNKPVGPVDTLLRAIAIDRGDATTPNGYVWVGSYNLGKVWRLDPRTGDYTATPGEEGLQLSAGFGGTYGAVVTSNNTIYWTSLNASYLSPLNATTLEVGPLVSQMDGSIYGATGDSFGRIWGSYGNRIVGYDPATNARTYLDVPSTVSSGITSDAQGNLWFGHQIGNGNVGLGRFPATAFVANGQIASDAATFFDTGVARSGSQSAVGVDRGGAVWQAHNGGDSRLVRYDVTAGTAQHYLGPNMTYSYSDFTGSVRRAATKQGSWEGIYQIPCANAVFNQFNLYGEYPTGSTTTVSVRRASTEAALATTAAIPLATVPANASPYALGTVLTGAGATSGAWMKVTIVLKQGANGATPIASGFRFNWTCPAP